MRQYRVSCGGRWLIGLSAYHVVRARHRSTSSFRYNITGFRSVREEQTRFARTSRVLGGGVEDDDAMRSYATSRSCYGPGSTHFNLGFRCVRSQ
jgi:formylglycine-generating enzyme required for sulfatase activity